MIRVVFFYMRSGYGPFTAYRMAKNLEKRLEAL